MGAEADPYSRVCGVIAARTVEEMLGAVERARAGVVELRLDYLRDPRGAAGRLREVVEAAHGRGRRVVATLRDAGEGGRYAGPPEVKAWILSKAVEAGVDYVDVEARSPAFEAVASLAAEAGVAVIASHHRLDSPLTAGEVLRIAREALAGIPGGEAVAKVVYACREPRDELAAMQAVAEMRGRLIAFAAGEGCMISRIAAPLLGAPFTYAHEHGGPAAPGQPGVEEVVTLWRLLRAL
ncbi:type I 3-dehydroquinate dehydratase [Stetteria hydrogenophila]